MFRIYVVNLGKYNEGYLIGEWIDLPATEEELQKLHCRIKVGRMENGEYVHGYKEGLSYYEEVAIHDFENSYGIRINEYDSISELNELAEVLENENENVVSALYDIVSTLDDLKRVLEEGDYSVLYDVDNEEDLGYKHIEEFSTFEIPENIEPYFDYERYGRDLVCNGWHISNNVAVYVY